MDSDYSVFSILPPYNTIEAQLIVNGQLVTASNGYSVTYESLADPAGAINRTSVGKSNFPEYARLLYGAELPPDVGLTGSAMPGTNNIPQPMHFETINQAAPGVFTPANWFHAEGIPVTPYDDAGQKNPYPLMRLTARLNGNPIATSDIVLPVSDEMDCRACHASGSHAAAEPANGWTWSGNPERDYRLNILRKHDESRFEYMAEAYARLLTTNGFNSLGLYQSVVADAHPVLCANCHLSEALPGTGVDGVPPLTQAVHGYHAYVTDPESGLAMDDSQNRSACYRCHPGSSTRCLRGAMGGAVNAADGSLAMQCQSCHGPMSRVGDSARVGWLEEPNCQSCHAGNAVSAAGNPIRYTSAFETGGVVRTPADRTFATQADTPAPNLSLYRYSVGHGGLQCSACHGSTHAIFPSIHPNDNLRNIGIQGHAGTTVECTACHTSMPQTFLGGPHGMHPAGATDFATKNDGAERWFHGNALEDGGPGRASCQACHGIDYRGTVLSRAHADRVIATGAYGTKTFWRGYQIGCYDCHNGPDSESGSAGQPPVVADLTTNTVCGVAVPVLLSAGDADGNPLTLRLVSQPAHGRAGLSGGTATYHPEPGFVGTDTFTYAANDGTRDSNLGRVTVTVTQGPFSISALARVPPDYPAGWPVPFAVVPTMNNVMGIVVHHWRFGDGSPQASGENSDHAYKSGGVYAWSVVSSVSDGGFTASVTNAGSITILSNSRLRIDLAAAMKEISWPRGAAQSVLEEATTLLPPASWRPSEGWPIRNGDRWVVPSPDAEPAKYYRLRRVR